MSDMGKLNRGRSCVTTTTAELRRRGLGGIVANTRNCREVLVTEPGHGWMASVLLGNELDVQTFATEPSQQWTEDFREWAVAVEALLIPVPAVEAA